MEQKLKFLVLSSFVLTVACVCSDVKTVKLCYNVYMESYELSSDPFPSYRAYKTVREMMLVEKGPAGQTTECSYTNSLISCLGNLEADCITTDQFGGYFNISTGDAVQYVQDYFMMKYTCNSGYSDAMKYFYCMEQVGLYETDGLINCSQALQNALGNGGGCSDYDQFTTCMINVFTAYCGNDIKNYICNLEVDGILAVSPSCKGQLQACPNPGFKSIWRQKLEKMKQAMKVLEKGYHVFP
ncbi:hypothetical protein FO519_004900 [Halicephalobus sp. NKZ332]|nr:hypothetical protein FO519_004900 [Halicephalobus sp. NKZ332]